jgi:hypothetical protein
MCVYETTVAAQFWKLLRIARFWSFETLCSVYTVRTVPASMHESGLPKIAFCLSVLTLALLATCDCRNHILLLSRSAFFTG